MYSPKSIFECAKQNILIPEYFVSFLQTDLARGYFLKAAKKTTKLQAST